jgi:putative tryptophan/tyrosine transport system substrate-binding protein
MRPLGSLLRIAAAMTSWALPASAQQPLAVVGLLTSGPVEALNQQWMLAFHRGLADFGLIDGQSVAIEYRGADDNYDRLPGLAAELVRRQVGVIVAAGGPISALAAKKVTATIPIVFTTVSDPVKSGLVASLNRPGGNLTGTAGLTSELDPKRLELLHQIKPSEGVIGVLVNPKRPGVEGQTKELETAARALGREIAVHKAATEQAIDAEFEAMHQRRLDSVVVTADPLFNFNRTRVVSLAARYRIPAVYQWREFVADGGLMSYGPSIADAYYQAGAYSGRILKGAKPADLPVMQPTRFELVINLRTAAALGLTVPELLGTIATETIE